MLRTRQIGAVAVAAAILGGGLATPALAGSAYSSWSYYSFGGVDYRSRSSIQTDSTAHWAFGVVGAGPRSVSVSAGWVGAQGNLYGTSGALYCAGTMTYNPAKLAANGTLWSSSSCTKHQVGNWQAHGVTKAWSSAGQAYLSHLTPTTPVQSS